MDDIESKLIKDGMEPLEAVGWLLSNADYKDAERAKKDVWWQRYNQLKALDNGGSIAKRLMSVVSGEDSSWRYLESAIDLQPWIDRILTGSSGSHGGGHDRQFEEHRLGTNIAIRHYPDRISRVMNPGAEKENERIVIDGHLEVREHLKVDENDFWRVKQEEEVLMSFYALRKQLESSSRVYSQRDLRDALSTVLRACPISRRTYGAFGIYSEDGQLVVCTDPVPVREEAAKVWEGLKDFVDRKATKEEVQNYVDILDFWHPYEVLPSFGLGLISPFALLLRSRHTLVPHLFNHAPESDLGKSIVVFIASECLWACEHSSGPALKSEFRLASHLDAIGLARAIDEAENLKDYMWPFLKVSAERRLADKRGTADLGMLDFLSRAVLLFDGNFLPIDSEPVLKRFIVPRFDSSVKLERLGNSEEVDRIYNSLEPIGYQLLRWALEEWPTEETFFAEFDRIELEIRRSGTHWKSPKRPQVWASVYMGLRIFEIGCKRLGVDWQAPSIPIFQEQVVKPVETATWDFKRNHVEKFAAWFDLWRVSNTIITKDFDESRSVVRGEDEIFKIASIHVGTEDLSGWWVSSALLQEYNRRKDGEARISSLTDLTKQSADMCAVPYDMVLDSKGTAKLERIGERPQRVAFVPHDLSGKQIRIDGD